jgi:hypothetical protein
MTLTQKVAAGIAVLLGILGWLTLAVATKDFIKMVKWGRPFCPAGKPHLDCLVGASSLGELIFDGGLTIVLLGVAAVLVRRYLGNSRLRTAVGVGAGLSLALGLVSGVFYH